MRNAANRLRPWLVGAAVLVLSLMPEAASAATSVRTMLDGNEISFPIPPVVEDGRTLVPARKLLESLGGTVGWDQATRTVTGTLGDQVVKVVIGSTQAAVGAQTVQLDVPARIQDGHTLIPLRFFVENLGLAVAWDNETRTILIDSRRSVAAVSRDGSAARRPAPAPAITPITTPAQATTEPETETIAPPPATGTASGAVAEALKLVGLPYSWGGTSPDTGFDCSGFIYYVTKRFGVELPRTSQEQFGVGTAVEPGDLLAGDLVFFTTYAEGPSHVGIYDGKGSFVHAQSAETGVKVTPMSNPWWSARYIGARRIFK